ncbi:MULTISPECIES: type VI secretion system protein TssA [Edwardsiella]|uniref:EvpK family type VI secretion protein n=2 Tax=Edwardsiella anguillarum TaxID=1821960 RepID=A0A076LQU7_9GAMM|nr:MULTISPECIES: type VI secretion system protein TssA [Edwardsiella]AIJ10366.1 EvpK family type VI secretion protein [Edwardsiella anguillarum ET080813]AKR77880.1 type VI secretion system protein TssA [Edwardsiella sp. LADL05-105]KAB0591989.1 type VI secretion system protein TssA [Edwardsiella anguillarum]WHP82201.1 type VI secretion system protein TssA [Edwardsiella anguillarum]WHP86001.1 type VI secretion system protein TssA [Edwardsiella anguillarum]
MSTLHNLVAACQADETQQRQQAQTRTENWQPWLAPVSVASPTGEDPGYDDDFQRIREEINKLSGIDTGLICTLAEKLLTTGAKDIRVATYYCWARLHQDGEAGFAEGLELLAGLLQRYGMQLHPQRDRSRKVALEWLAGTRVLDSLSLYPEVIREDAQRTAGALLLITDSLETEPKASRPELNALYRGLESRLMKAGGVDAVVPQNAGNKAQSHTSTHTTESDVPVLSHITSGQDLLAQARTLTGYLREQPDGWLAAHRLMKSLRHDTLSAIPALDAEGKTRIEPPRADQRAMLKRLYLQQSWLEILEQADSTFSRGANHLWLDLQWYTHQALVKSGQEVLAEIITADLKGLLRRLSGLETLAFNDGTPFADEVTLNWINQSVLDGMPGWREAPVSAVSETDNDILALEPEALEKADNEGLDATLQWLQTRPGTDNTRDKWLLRLLMARVAEQKGKNELALHLLGELDGAAQIITLTQWTPELLFEVKSRRLRLLRMKATRSETDKSRFQAEMDQLLAGLIALDPASSAVLCG